MMGVEREELDHSHYLWGLYRAAAVIISSHVPGRLVVLLEQPNFRSAMSLMFIHFQYGIMIDA